MKTRWLSRLRSIQVARALQQVALAREREERAGVEELEAAGAHERALSRCRFMRERREEVDSVGRARWLLSLEAGGQEACRATRRAANQAAREAHEARQRCAETLEGAARSWALRQAAARIERRWRQVSERRREAREEERHHEERQATTGRREDAMHIHATQRRAPLTEAAPAARAAAERFEQLLSAGAAGAGPALGCGWVVALEPVEAMVSVQTAGASAIAASVELERAILERLEAAPMAQAELAGAGVELRLRSGELDGLVCRIRVIDGAVDCRLRERSAVRRVELRALAPELERRLAAAGLRLGRWEVRE